MANVDLLAITNVSFKQLSRQKWMSHCFLTAVVFIAMLPFILVRYFLGDMNVGTELYAMVWTLASALVLGALGVLTGTLPLGGRILAGIGVMVGIVMFDHGALTILMQTKLTISAFGFGFYALVTLLAIIALLALADARFDTIMKRVTIESTPP